MLKPKPLGPALRLIDKLLWPIMKLSSGHRLECPQETHVWHSQRLTEDQIKNIDLTKCTEVASSDESSLTERSLIFFHLPILGGWREYVVLEQTETMPWHVGWLVYNEHGLVKASLHRLPIIERQVRLLTGAKGYRNIFFAVGGDGQQLPLNTITKASLGDSRFSKLRLF